MTQNTTTPFRKTGVAKPTPANLEQVVEQLRQIVLELQGAVGPPGLRAVRVEELVRIGIVRVTPDGLTLGPNVGGSGTTPIPPPPVTAGTYNDNIDYDSPLLNYDG
jgi:hypothetical protein